MSQYLISVFGADDDELPDEATMQAMFAAVDDFNQQLKDSGAWVFAGGLHPATTATTVDGTKGPTAIVTDGPYLETKEHLGGFWVVEAPDLDAALELARQGSAACQGRVEVRPFQDA